MPRTARLDIPGLVSHVIIRGIERRKIFRDDQDRGFFLHRLSSLLVKTETDCLAWALLPNHIHMLLRPKSNTLATIMRRLLTSYAVTFNKRHKRSGHLFQNRYKSLICDEESYLLTLIRYIHLNPLQAGLVDGIEDLTSYPWSGHAVIMGKRSLPGQVTGEVIERFGKTKKKGRAGYASFIAEGAELPSPKPQQPGGLRRWLAVQVGEDDTLARDDRILGSETFCRRVIPELSDMALPSQRSLVELQTMVANQFSLAPELLLRRTRQSGVAEARALLCWLAVRREHHSGAGVARALCMSRAGVCLAIRRGEQLLVDKPELSESLDNYLAASHDPCEK